MAKKKNSHKYKKAHNDHHSSLQSKHKGRTNNNLHNQSSNKSKNFHEESQSLLPIPFPYKQLDEKKIVYPGDDDIFLRNTYPYKQAFEIALDTSYLGFAYDKSKNDSNAAFFQHAKIEQALNIMYQNDYFLTDVTQPFGLGTPCAKTYVTRCLLGEPGTTYKYLGLRMFSHPWNVPNKQNEKAHDSSKRILNESLHTMKDLNSTLILRTKAHLRTLDTKRKRIYNSEQHLNETNKIGNLDEHNDFDKDGNSLLSTIRGRATFDVTLINRMVDSNDLKMEPMSSSGSKSTNSSSEHRNKKISSTNTTINDGDNNLARTSVSWHADSCLEHYSSIGVYHTIIPVTNNTNHSNGQGKPKQKGTKRQWSIALRVSHHAEGPTTNMSLSSNDKESLGNKNSNTSPPPPIAISLPSGSAYYLLEDFNHHHQHAVLAENVHVKKEDNEKNENSSNNIVTKYFQKQNDIQSNPGIRYSSTHRLLRQGHNVFYILERCKNVCSNFHKKGIKVWKTEQLLLADIEFEWLRQFFIQGRKHKNLLWDVSVFYLFFLFFICIINSI